MVEKLCEQLYDCRCFFVGVKQSEREREAMTKQRSRVCMSERVLSSKLKLWMMELPREKPDISYRCDGTYKNNGGIGLIVTVCTWCV